MAIYRILSLDGGGIRGLMTAVWLARLEKELGAPIRDHFDLIAGTSTGSILAASLVVGTPASDLVALYRRLGKKVFPSPASRRWSRVVRTFSQGVSAPKYDDTGLQEALKDQFGNTRLKDLKPRVGKRRRPILLITSYETLVRQAKVFKTVPDPMDHPELLLWEAVKASCSAPVYFPAHVAHLDGAPTALIDGGVVANNPTACAIAEAVRRNAENKDEEPPCVLEDFIVASMGTGELTRSISIADAREWGAIEWALPIIDVLFDGAADATHYIAKHLIPDGQYFRFQTRLDKAYDDMDNADETNLDALIIAANHHLKNEQGEAAMTKLAAALKKPRR